MVKEHPLVLGLLLLNSLSLFVWKRLYLTFIFNYFFSWLHTSRFAGFSYSIKKCHLIFWLPLQLFSFYCFFWLVSSWLLLRFSSSLVVWSLSMMYLGKIFFVFIPHRVHRASCTCILISLVSFGKFSVFFLNFTSICLFSFFILLKI